MAQPFGVGDVVSGRYRITHHVVTSADQDIVFQATDDVLDRQVSVLLASRSNAKQVATSAKELATGRRRSGVEVLDLGLSQDRTYLISTLVDPNQLLDLVVPDTAPYVEPYFTDSLGSQLFGQSREMQPQTYDDDAEYYARLHSGLLAPGDERERRRRARRPAFLDKVTPAHRRRPDVPAPEYSQEELESELGAAGDAHGIEVSQEIKTVFSLRSDLDEVPADPAADDLADPIEAVLTQARGEAPPSQVAGPTPTVASTSDEPSGPEPTGDSAAEADPEQSELQSQEPMLYDAEEEAQGPFVESLPSAPISTVAVSSLAPRQTGLDFDALVAEGEVVVDDPPEEPDDRYDRRAVPMPADIDSPNPQTLGAETVSAVPRGGDSSGSFHQEPHSFTSLISAVPARRPSAFPSAEGAPAQQQDPAPPTLTPSTRWIAAVVLGVLVLAAAIAVFLMLLG